MGSLRAKHKVRLEMFGTESPWARLRARLEMFGTKSPWVREIVYPCIPDPDGEDEGGQVSSLAYLHDGSLQQNSSNLTSQLLRRGREENRRGRPKL
ncbi:hypothetical protein BHM03_00030741 [Ensete ventricosum]|nr:hypothetical protein BHM03_00030741 [Ensete ventricosum]